MKRLRSLVVTGLRAATFISIAAWVFDLPARLGLALFSEQLLMLVLGLSLALTFSSLPLAAGRPRARASSAAATRHQSWLDATDLLLAAAALAACLYVALYYPELTREWVDRPWQGVTVASVIVLLVFEASRRSTGIALVLIVLALCLHALFGWLLPEQFATRPVALSRLMVYLAVDTNALLGGPLDIAVRVVAPFVFFGHILASAGGAQFFADVALALMGPFRGGSAKVAVLASGLFGTMSGSAVANVASVGTLTIPMMTRAGLPPHLAAAIEAVGSTGGQIAPPVMGAAAFLMAEYLQVPYADVAVAAALPALLFYAALFMQVDLESARLGIRPVPRTQRPVLAGVIREGWHFVLPFVVLVGGLLYLHFAAELSAACATLTLAVLALTVPHQGRRRRLAELWRALLSATGSLVEIIAISAIAGVLIGVLNLTGTAFSLTQQLLALSAGHLGLLLVYTSLAAFLLGLPLPTVGVYVVLAALAAPALIQAGVQPMTAHLFVLFNGILGMVTPPVALAAFAAASIAQADTWKTSWAATRMSWCAYLIPFMMVYSPELTWQGGIASIALRLALSLFGMFLGTIALVGFFETRLTLAHRLIYAAFALALLVQPGMLPGAALSNTFGLLGGALSVVWDLSRQRRRLMSPSR